MRITKNNSFKKPHIRKLIFISGPPYNPTIKICTEQTKRCKRLDPENTRKQHCIDYNYCKEPFLNLEPETKQRLSQLIIILNSVLLKEDQMTEILLLRELFQEYQMNKNKMLDYEEKIVLSFLKKYQK